MPYKQQTVTGTVVRVISHGTTMYGNPMLSVVLDTAALNTTYRLSNDASLAYGINNPDYRNKPHTFALTRAGRISHTVK